MWNVGNVSHLASRLLWFNKVFGNHYPSLILCCSTRRQQERLLFVLAHKKRAMERGIQLTQLTTPAVSRLGQCHNSHRPHFIYIEQNCSTNSNKVRSHHSHIVIVHAAGVSWLSCFLTLKATFGDTKALGSVWTRGITWLCRENLYMEKTTASKSFKRVKFRLCQWNEMIYTPERQHGTRKWTPEISWQSRFFFGSHHYQVLS